MAPVDIIINIIKRHLEDVKEQQKVVDNINSEYKAGKRVAYEDLIAELEGFKRLFN